MLVVLTLIGVTALFAVPRYESLAGLGRADRALRVLSGAFAHAQDQALFTRSPGAVLVNLDGPAVSVEGTGKWTELSGLELAVERSDGRGFVENGSVSIPISVWGDVDPVRFRVGRSTVYRLNPITGNLDRE